MTDYENAPGVSAPEPPEAETGQRKDDAWSEVVSSLDELGRSVTIWARSVKDDPENRQRARQLQEGLENAGRQIGEVIDTAAKSDFGQQLGQAALKTGDVVIDSTRRVVDEVVPHLAGAFKSAAEGLRVTAEKLERGATRSGERSSAQASETQTQAGPSRATTAESHPSPTPAPYTGEQPPAPAPSGIHEDEPAT